MKATRSSWKRADALSVCAKKGWAVGDVVKLGKKSPVRSIRFWVAHVAGIVLMLRTIQFGIYHYCGQPATYISLDVNPSIEITVNRLDKVMSAAAYNENGTRTH
mgnify:CR=1 FL=1